MILPMLGMFLLIIRRSLRNVTLTAAVLVGLLVLVTLMVAAPLYTTALADIGLRATLADAPLDQRSVRIVHPTDRLDERSFAEATGTINRAAGAAAWLRPA